MLSSKKYVQKYFQKYLLLWLWLFGVLTVQAQRELVQFGGLLYGDTLSQDSLLQFLEKENLLPEFQLAHLDMFDSFTEKKEVLEKGDAWKEHLKRQGLQEQPLKTQISNHNYFFYGDTIFTAGVSANWYSDIGVESKLSLGKIPVAFGGNVVLAEGKFQSELSTLHFSFDSEQFLENLKEEYKPSLGQDFMEVEGLFDMKQNPLLLSKEEWKALRKETQYVLYEQIINSPKFRAYQAKLHHQLDSLQADTLSVLKNGVVISKTSKDSIQTKLDKVVAIVGRYRNYWEERKEISFETKKEISQKVEELTTKLDDYTNPEKIKERLLTKGTTFKNEKKDSVNKKLSKWERLLLQTKAIDIGLFDVDDSDLTAKYLALNGFRYAYDSGRVYGEFAYGNQSLNTSFIPSFNALWLNRYYGNRFLFSKVGVKGIDESVYTQVSFIKGDVLNNPEDSLFVLPKRNTVIAWAGQMKVAKQSYLNAEFGVSDQDIVLSTGIEGDDEQVPPEKVAFAVHGKYDIDKWDASIEVGYFYNGAQYYTLSNPYLLTNRQGLSLKTQIATLDKRLAFRLDTKYGTAIDKSAVGFSDFQLLGELQYQFKNQNSLIFQVMPNVYQQTQVGLTGTGGQAVKTGTNNWIYSLQSNFFKNLQLPLIDEAQLISVFSATNLQSNFAINGTAVADSEELQNYGYLYLQEMLLWNEKQNINLTGLFGFDDWQHIRAGQTQLVESLIGLEYAHTFSKVKVGLGGQLLKRQIYGQWQYGIQAKVNYQFWQRGNLSINATYRNKLESRAALNNLELEQYFGNVSLSFLL